MNVMFCELMPLEVKSKVHEQSSLTNVMSSNLSKLGSNDYELNYNLLSMMNLGM